MTEFQAGRVEAIAELVHPWASTYSLLAGTVSGGHARLQGKLANRLIGENGYWKDSQQSPAASLKGEKI